ncbi:hypothetical protein BH10PAT1_BH10PAT1_6350 [soil metagenome]
MPITTITSSPIPSINVGLILAVVLLLGIWIIIIALVGFIIFTLYKNRNREERSLKSVLLEVAVSQSNDIKIDAMEQLFSSLNSIKKGGWKQKYDTQPVISFEIVAKLEDIRFYVWCPKKLEDLIEKQIHGAYPDAQVTEVDEYNIFTENGKVAYKSYQLKKANFYPIKTFKDLATDPMSSLTSALAKMGEGEAASIQVVLSPAEIPWQKEGKGFISSTKKQESDPEKAKFSIAGKTLESVESKVTKPGFDTSVRVVVVANTEESAKAHLSNIGSAFEQFNGELNGLGGRKIFRKEMFMEDFIYRYQPMYNVRGNHVSVLSSEELATIFHFPNKQITTPHIFWVNAKTAPAPSQIPTSGMYLGVSNYHGIKRPVYLGNEDRLRHMYIIGKTGTGKSEFLKQMILQDINEGKGLCFMDPHGDAVEEILELIPPERAEDVIYFNPSDTERPIGLNLLEANTEDQKHFAATAVINMMYKLFDPYKTGIVGPRFEHAVRNAMLTAMSDKETSFVEVMRILTDSKFVQELLPKVTDPIVRRYWTDQIAQTSDFHKSEVLDYITSKFGRFVTNKLIRNIIGQSKSSFDLREVMDTGKILLINLSKGTLGEENSNFLGLILVPRILMAAMSRADTLKENRRDFYLYVDEFPNFATHDFAIILSEARKYRLGLTVANQFIGQVEEEVKAAIFGNVGTIVSFRIGVTDASYITHEFQPVFSEDDLLNVEKYHAFMRTIVGNEPVPPFSIDTTKDITAEKAKANPRIAEIIKEMSRLRYGKDARLVEAEITRRAKL